jgi:hypothetical protein
MVSSKGSDGDGGNISSPPRVAVVARGVDTIDIRVREQQGAAGAHRVSKTIAMLPSIRGFAAP